MSAYKLIFLILLGALSIRLFASFPGYPPYHSDEGISYSAATSMLKSKTVDPERYDYPALVPIINYISYSYFFIPVEAFKYVMANFDKIFDGYMQVPLNQVDASRVYRTDLLGSREINALTWGRITTALVSIGNVLMVFLIGKRLFNRNTGLIAACLLAVNYRAVLNGVLGLPDTYNAFFLLLSFYFNLKLYEQPKRLNYILAGVAAGLSLSVKYQPFGLLMLGLVHMSVSINLNDVKASLKKLFNPYIFLSILLCLLVFIALNPYILIQIEETQAWLTQVAGKYRPRRYQIDFFALSYLYHFGIGKITFILALVGALVVTTKRTAVFLLSCVLLPFFYITIYYSGGGFYTRNFVSITPFIVLLSAAFYYYVTIKFHTIFTKVFLLIIFSLALYENIVPSITLAKEYRKEWTYVTLANWERGNMPASVQVSAHSSVPLPETAIRSSYDFNLNFSLSEFRDENSAYAISNFDWSTNEFYWWMTLDSPRSLQYWEKPVHILSEMYPAKAINELKDYSIHTIMKDGYAPESAFLVAHIPKLTISKTNELLRFSFNQDTEGWKSTEDDSLLVYENGTLVIPDKVPTSLIDRWESPPIQIDSDIYIEADITTTGSAKEGFLYAKLFSECSNNTLQYDYIRLSSRNNPGDMNIVPLAFKRPGDSKCMVLGFQSYNPQKAKSALNEVRLYNAQIEENREGWIYKRAEIDDAIMYPNSHGNL